MGVPTWRWWEMNILSAPLIIQQAQKLIIHCLHNNELSDPCSSPLSLNCEKTHGPFNYKCYLKFHGHLTSNCWTIFVRRSPKMYINVEFLLKASHQVSWLFFFSFSFFKALKSGGNFTLKYNSFWHPGIHLHNQFSKAETYLQNVLASPGLHITLTNASA